MMYPTPESVATFASREMQPRCGHTDAEVVWTQQDMFAAERSASTPGGLDPLSQRMRPRALADVIGHPALVGRQGLLRRLVDSGGRLPSLILWGPPGVGKTTIARAALAEIGQAHVELSATSAGVAQIREALGAYQRGGDRARRVLLIDELHRLSRNQQEVLLPLIEEGQATVIGTTTENPAFSLSSALLSRMRVFVVEQLDEGELIEILKRCLEDSERGLGGLGVKLEVDAEAALLRSCGGDARVMLDALEMACLAASADQSGVRSVDRASIEEVLKRVPLRYDGSGDMHYGEISALIKSVRGSDPDAAVYWLARMLESGEDPLFVARRLVILAAEDIGLADPQALPLAVASQQSVHLLGMPEAYLPLAEATIYLAVAPKSNSALRAYGAALADVRSTGNLSVPTHLRNASSQLDRALGHGRGYLYGHDHPGSVVAQQYLPGELAGRRYYQPTGNGAEQSLARRLQEIRRLVAKQAGDQAVDSGAGD